MGGRAVAPFQTRNRLAVLTRGSLPAMLTSIIPPSLPLAATPLAVATGAAAGPAPGSAGDFLRFALPLLAAVVTALVVDRMAERRGWLPPGFRDDRPGGRWRRVAGTALLAGFFWVGIFASFGMAGRQVEIDLSTVGSWTLFALHAVIAATLLAWGALAFPRRPAEGAGVEGASREETTRDESTGDETTAAEDAEEGAVAPPAPPSPPHATPLRALIRAVGLEESDRRREIAVGLVTGVLIWAAVLAVVTALGVLLTLAGRDDWLPQGPPELVVFIASQPFWIRLLGSLSAGFVEETFFRGFLQPRVGVGLSTLLFALAHWSYGEPFMLVGVTLLSLTYAGLYHWRGSVWAAATAHAVFDGVQLLILMPLALETLPEAVAGAAWCPALW